MSVSVIALGSAGISLRPPTVPTAMLLLPIDPSQGSVWLKQCQDNSKQLTQNTTHSSPCKMLGLVLMQVTVN